MEAGIAVAVGEVVAVVAAAVEVVAVKGLEQAVGTLQVLHSARGDPVEGWGIFPFGPSLARYSKQAGSWVRGEVEGGEEVELEMTLHSSAKHVKMLEVEA